MAKFLRLGNGKGRCTCGTEIFTQRPIEGRRLDKVIFRNVGVSIVLHHTGIKNVRNTFAVELGKILLVECTRDLDGPVSPEVEKYHRITVFYGTDRFSILYDHEARYVLVGDFRVLLVVGQDGLCGRREAASLSKDVGIPSIFHDTPVGIVPIHGGHHPSSAGRYAVVAAVR